MTALWRGEEKKVLQVQVELEKAREAVRGAEKRAMEAKTEAATQVPQETERDSLQVRVDELEAERQERDREVIALQVKVQEWEEDGQQLQELVRRLRAEVAGLKQGVAYQQTAVQQWGHQQKPTRSRITGTQWDVCCTANGKMYYVDTETGKTQWELPLQVTRTA